MLYVSALAEHRRSGPVAAGLSPTTALTQLQADTGLQFEFLGNPVVNWGLAVITFLVTLTVLPIVKGFIAARRRSWTPNDRLQLHSASPRH